MVFIKELLPNPVGRDAGGEWIKLFNDGEDVVNLNGWQIKDLSGKSLNLAGNINPKNEINLKLYKSKIILNNKKETVFLYDPSGKLIDKLAYSNPYEGEIITTEEFSNKLANSYFASPIQAFSENLLISETHNLSPLFIGILLAVFMGWVSILILKKIAS
ncbi:MAG: lamin tail domain-containing protein [Candidatus Colwellbacteria bacterium]|nr:lamin tail domain-containing protein [Candidatus Colwellbacteria bacterium]MBI3273838.1 lamin tail domain-containing protein [Candidatus Colwellbacteria bacterium]